MMQKTLRAYTRKSFYDSEGSDRFAHDRQKSSIEAWANLQGPFRVIWYEDLDISGLNEGNRPGWLRLVADLNSATDYGVIVEDYDRSHRNVREALAFYDDILAPRKIKYISTLHNLDLSTADGRAWFTDRMKYAEWEARKARERMERTIKYKVEKLGRHWGRNPFGCDRDPKDKQLVPTQKLYFYNPITGIAGLPAEGYDAPPPGVEIRYFFDALYGLFLLHSSGQRSLNDTAIAANSAGWRHWTHDGSPVPFSRIDVHRILRSWRLYAGELPPGYLARHSRAVLSGGHQPILPIELCYKISEVLEQRRHVRVPENLVASVYLLSGIARCGYCGSRLTGQPMNNHRTLYYRHSDTKAHDCPERMVRCEQLDDFILEMLAELVGLEEVIRNVTNKVKQALQLSAAGPDTMSVLQSKQEQMERLIDLHLLGRLTQEQFLKRQSDLQTEIDNLEGKVSTFGAIANLDKEVGGIMSNLARINEAPTKDKRAIISRIINQVFVKDRKITKIVPSDSAMPLFSMCALLPLLHSEQQPTLTILQFIKLPKQADLLI